MLAYQDGTIDMLSQRSREYSTLQALEITRSCPTIEFVNLRSQAIIILLDSNTLMDQQR